MDGSSGSLVWVATYLVLLIIGAVQTSYSAAVFNLSEGDLDQAEGKGAGSGIISESSMRRVREVRENPLRLRGSVAFFHLLSACIGTVLLEENSGGDPFLISCVSIALIYVFGMCIPDLIGKSYSLATVRRLSGLSGALIWISAPFTGIPGFAGGLFFRLLGIDQNNLKGKVTEDEILSMVNEGSERGSIDENEAEMITNIFEMDDKQAKDIMTHRASIVGIAGDRSLNEAVAFILKAQNSRFPVYEENIDNIVGALYLKDAMCFYIEKCYNDCQIRDIPSLLREVKFIPLTVNINDLFEDMQKSRRQMAIVIDEYGGTSGLVTMEDILEEIVGNILDEYDREEKLISPVGEGRLRIYGKASLDEVSEELGVKLDQDNYDTLNGYLTEKLGHIPSQTKDLGKVIEDKELGWKFRILSINGSIIGLVEAMRDNTELETE